MVRIGLGMVGVLLTALLALGMVLDQGAVRANYTDEEGPLYSSAFATAPPPSDGDLAVVTYNIRFAEKIDAAAADLQRLAETEHPDVVLLQEMDESGTREIAQVLGMNYVYYPASIHRHGEDFGNAILSAWPIREPEKVILPHENPLNGQIRTATRAVVEIEGRPVLVYSAHTETRMMTAAERADQIAAVAADIDPQAPYVVVGGDFNSLTVEEARAVAGVFARQGLVWASEGAGPTFVKYSVVGAPADQIYSRGFEPVSSGTLAEATGSDHYPLWARLDFVD